jgi:hypothetical protein
MSKFFVSSVLVLGANAQKLSVQDASRIEGILRADEAVFSVVSNKDGKVEAVNGLIEFDDAETELDVVTYYAGLIWMELNKYVEVKVASVRIDLAVPITATKIQFRRIAEDTVSE